MRVGAGHLVHVVEHAGTVGHAERENLLLLLPDSRTLGDEPAGEGTNRVTCVGTNWVTSTLPTVTYR